LIISKITSIKLYFFISFDPPQCVHHSISKEDKKTLIIILLSIIGAAFLFFIIHTIRCYLTKPAADEDDDEYKIKFDKNEKIQPL
jgi:hypothetical protein